MLAMLSGAGMISNSYILPVVHVRMDANDGERKRTCSAKYAPIGRAAMVL